MRKLGNLTARDLGAWVTIPEDPHDLIPERAGRVISIEHHYGDGTAYGRGRLTTIVAETDAPHPHVWTYVPDYPCTTEGGHQ